MKKKHTPGNCDPCVSCREQQYFSTSDWTVGAGGSITNLGFDGLLLDGDVQPKTFISAEAWLITFGVKGAGTITADGIVFAFDSEAQTISIDSDTIDCGRAAFQTPGRIQIAIRVTPTHAFIYGVGDYRTEGSGGFHHSILTIDRSTDAPSSFDCDWDSATITNFEMFSSQVVVNEGSYGYSGYYGGEVLRNCFTQLADPDACPYLAIKESTGNHSYVGSPVDDSLGDTSHTHNSGDVDISDLTVTMSKDVFPSDPPEGDYFAGPDLPLGGTQASAPVDPLERRFGNSPCASTAVVSRWFDLDPPYQIQQAGAFDNPNTTISKSIQLQFGEPTPQDPYPKPQYVATLEAILNLVINCYYSGGASAGFGTWKSGGEASVEFPANDLSSGFTLTIVGQDLGVEWSAGEPPPTASCDDGDGDGIPTLSPDSLASHPSAAILGVEWTFSP